MCRSRRGRWCRRRPARSGPSWSTAAPVKAPRTWPKSSDSSSVSGMAAQLTLMSGMSRCGAAVVDGARDQLLAGAGLAGDEHRALRLGHQLGPLDDVLHRAAAPDDAVVVELRVALAAAGSGSSRAQRAGRSSARRARPAVRRSRTASAGSRGRRASWPRRRSRWWRAPSSSRSAGRSASGVVATYLADRGRGRSMSASGSRHAGGRTCARASSRWPRGRWWSSTTSWPSSRRARPRVFRIFSSSSTRRIEPRWRHVTLASRAVSRAESTVNVGAAPGCWLRQSCHPAPRRCSLRSARPSPVPARLVVKYGSKMLGEVARRRCRRRGRAP